MKISELFYSVQGEGKLLGVPSVFVRASGCNLRCVWCDTPYASWQPEGEDLNVRDIVHRIREHDSARHVVLTGGEPLIMPDVLDLCSAIKTEGLHLTIETAGTVYHPVELDLASVSPKLSNSTPHDRDSGRFVAMHERQRINVPVIQQFIDASPDFQLKFVIAEESDLLEVEELLTRLTRWKPADVLLMPEGTDASVLGERAGWLSEVCKQYGYRFCPRLHVMLYGNKRGT